VISSWVSFALIIGWHRRQKKEEGDISLLPPLKILFRIILDFGKVG